MYLQGMDSAYIYARLGAFGYRKRQLDSARRQLDAERDQLIHDAYEAGVPIRQIHLRSGIARTTIYRVLGLEAESDETDT